MRTLRFVGHLASVSFLLACASTQRGQQARPALGPGAAWLTVAPDGSIGLCALRDREDRICGWAKPRAVESWLREVDRLLAAGEEGRAQTSDLALSGGAAVHFLRGSPGAVAAFQLVFSDQKRHLSSGDPLTRERAEAVLARLRSTIASVRASN